jgi:hypothetical protein
MSVLQVLVEIVGCRSQDEYPLLDEPQGHWQEAAAFLAAKSNKQIPVSLLISGTPGAQTTPGNEDEDRLSW